MVKLKGPGLAKGASGTLAGILTFGKTKGRSYLKKRSVPSQPKTPLQRSNRAAVEQLTKRWNEVAPTYEEDWHQLALELDLTPYHAYLKTNLDRWSIGRGLIFTPPGYITPYTAEYSAFTATGQNRRIVFSFTLDTYNWERYAYLNAALGEASPIGWHNIVGIGDVTTEGNYKFTVGPLPPGTYWCRLRLGQLNGRLCTWSTSDPAIVQ